MATRSWAGLAVAHGLMAYAMRDMHNGGRSSLSCSALIQKRQQR